MAKRPGFFLRVFYRCAICGHFVTQKYLKKHPKTTVTERRWLPLPGTRLQPH